MESKGLYKAMGELDLLFNYIETYLASSTWIPDRPDLWPCSSSGRKKSLHLALLVLRPLFTVLSWPVVCTDFLKGRGEKKKKGTYSAFSPPKRAVYHVLTSQGGSLVCFANQEGTLVCVFQQLGHGTWGQVSRLFWSYFISYPTHMKLFFSFWHTYYVYKYMY